MWSTEKKEQAQGAELNLEANGDWLSKLLKLEENEPRNGRRVLRNLSFILKDGNKRWLKALVPVEF